MNPYLDYIEIKLLLDLVGHALKTPEFQFTMF
jgi:hypothetical protein